MRLVQSAAFFASLSLATAQLVVQELSPLDLDRSPGSQKSPKQQQPLGIDDMPPPPVGPAVPPDSMTPGGDIGNDGPGGPSGTVILSDVLGHDRSINVFAGFTRDFAPITNRFDDVTQNSTVLAPLNSAIEKLPRKPWEAPEDYVKLGAGVYDEPGGQERAQLNLRRFVEAHIVPVSPWPEKMEVQAMAGSGKVWWEKREDGMRVIKPGNIEVAGVANTVANGQVWIIKGVRNYAS